LQKLMLAGNALTELPTSLAACTKLELLRIAANRLSALPPWLLDMPRLAWLAYAGNPFSAADEAAATPAENAAGIAWDRLAIEHKLGEGASGVIYRATLCEAGAVAVKLFKGAITSDGLPDCELAACVSAGAHANLIPVLGEVTGHPDKVRGCAMALIDPAFGNLAGPPSLDSCTRDIYADGRRFSLEFVLRLAEGIAAAARHLHQRGIMHGDLYGHNILAMDDGTALLGDFGAASMHAVDGAPADALQRLEVRAFGVLLGELIERCDAGDRLAHLRELHEQCVQSTVAARPLFGDIVERIVASS
ncbi:MAG: leucine Rich Repeat family protein, partial [Massilia sp.]|nr:leucine Rich Repeat family protein [Massilia sp.]